ncbi:unnamed protein product [Ilex paraguariensis]|uniref:Poly A polymerase head domain-containing protein n=1 Tax=Ilex paraguariensis TaxID=185542 RepID=A0ABC8U6U1_9AQUA
MAIASGLGFACRPHHFPIRSPLRHCVISKVRPSTIAAIETFNEPESLYVKDNTNHDSVSPNGKLMESDRKAPKWKKLGSKDIGISTSMIARPTRVVLNGLKRKGYEVFLVGGCVRDLILGRTPKDFDVITSAELKEVMRTFSRCEIIGRRFPICHVHIDDSIVEVSSFSTCATKSGRSFSLAFERPFGCDQKDYVRWKNCLQRDFTINGLMFDPYAKIVYDYMGGLEDIKKAKVQTIVPASFSFLEDCARILRAVRIAARLGFRFSKETAQAVKNLSCSVLKLDKKLP